MKGEGSGFTRRRFVEGTVAGSLGLALGGLAACGEDEAAVGTGTTAPEEAATGGRLRVGVAGGGASESLDPNQVTAEMDTARNRSLFEGLAGFDPDGKVVNVLAEELEPNADASVWTVRVRQDVEFHNGKSLTADDVAYSLRYIVDPENATQGAGTLADLPLDGVVKIDDRTVELRLNRANAFLPDQLAEFRVRIFPDGTTSWNPPGNPPVGTGPFKFESWTRGERSLFVRHENYHGEGPFLDELEYISIDDPSARLNALQAGQVDAISQLDPSLVSALQGNDDFTVLEKPSGNYTALYVQMNKPPFNDVRVRQALRLLVDREQMLSNALQGTGRLGNDIPGWFDAHYNSDIPQREYDPEQAKSLLAAAGQSDLRVTLQTSNVAPAMLESSTLFAEQAKAGGVTVTLRKWPADQYYTKAYAHFPFAMTNWLGRTLASQINLAYLTTSPFNETNMRDKQLDELVGKAFAEPDEQTRIQLMKDAQQILWDRGGTIIWGFLSLLDATSAKVEGITPSVIVGLGNYDLSKARLKA